MRIFFLLISLFLSEVIFAQNTFNRTYVDSTNWSAKVGNTIEIDSVFYCLSSGNGLVSNSNYIMFSAINSNGDVINRRLVGRPFNIEAYSGRIAKDYKNFIYADIGQRLVGNPDKFNTNVVKLTLSFDTIWNLKNSDSTFHNYSRSIAVYDSLVYVVGAKRLDSANPIMLSGYMIIADTAGFQHGFTEYNFDNHSQELLNLSKGMNYDLFLSGSGKDTMSNFYGLLVNTDLSGNVNWFRRYYEMRNIFDILPLSDSSYILTGGVFNDGEYRGILIKINSDGDVIWQREFPFGYELSLYSSIQVLDEGIVSIGLTTLNSTNGNDGFIQRINYDGNLVWQRYFNGSASVTDYFTDIIETSDGGILACGAAGDANESGGQNLWLVKLDSLGCLEPDCWVGVEQADANTLGVAVYPNPATDWLYLKYDNTSKISLEIFNLSGQRVLQHQHMAPKEGIEISHLPSGLYLLRFVDEFGNMATEKLVVE
jgi:hypothetical protein